MRKYQAAEWKGSKMAKSYTIAGETFGTQKDLVARVRAIIRGCRNMQRLDVLSQAFVLDLLERHPDADQKIGCGVDYLYVDENPKYPGERSRGFRLVRVDGASTDFSYWECLKPTPHRKKVLNAMRAKTEGDTLAFKNSAFEGKSTIICPDTGKPITFTTSHVDHVAPLTFPVLVDGFLSATGLIFDDIKLRPSGDNQFQDEFADESLAEEWRKYHADNAQLEVVSEWSNLSIRRRAA